MTDEKKRNLQGAPEGDALEVSRYRDPILDSINEGVFTVDAHWRITSFNRAAERITGIARDQAIGHRCAEVLRANICEEDCALKEALDTGEPVSKSRVFVLDAAGGRIPIKVSAASLREPEGRVIGGVETFQDLRQVEELRRRLKDKHSFFEIVGRSRAITSLFDVLPQIANSDSTVLIQGASGTGKELFARAIHQLSRRRRRRFVAVNCGALPDTLLESELFGYRAGAFTGARRDKPGRFAAADGGILFLDEIGDVSPAMQVRLLRVLQERSFEPLGSVEPVRTDVRIVAASNKDLKELMHAGRFREDLFYRVNVVRIDIPPLADRPEDIPLLIDHFVGSLNRAHGKAIAGLSPEALARLMEHDFPGNVRELYNALEHAFALCDDESIGIDHLPPNLRQGPAADVARGGSMSLELMERTLIREALRKHEGNRTRAAAELGIDPSTLYRKIKRLEIEVPARDGRGSRS